MNSPTETLRALSLLKPLCLSSSFLVLDLIFVAFLSIPVLVRARLWYPALPQSFSPLSAPEFESALLWQFLFFLQGMHEWLHRYESTSGSSSSQCLACACSASPATLQCCERMLHQGCGQDYLKNLLKLILLFFFFLNHFCSFCTSWQTSSVRMELNEAISVWNTSSFWLLSLCHKNTFTVRRLCWATISVTNVSFLFHTWVSLCVQMLTDT